MLFIVSGETLGVQMKGFYELQRKGDAACRRHPLFIPFVSYYAYVNEQGGGKPHPYILAT